MSANPRPTYAPIALGRLEKVGEKRILQYFKSVPLSALNHIAKLLPAVSGFRPGTSATLERQLQTLAHKLSKERLTKSFARSKDELGLYAIWRAWSQHYLAPSIVTDNLFEALETEVDSDSSTDPLSKAMIDALVAYTAASEVGQETLIQFVTMSPFDEIGEMVAIARRAKSADQIHESAVLKELPTRLQKVEGVLKDLGARVAAIEAVLTDPPPATAEPDPNITFTKDLTELKAAIAGEADKIRDLTETIDRLSGLVAGQANQTKSFELALSGSLRAAAEAATKANLRLDDVESNILGYPGVRAKIGRPGSNGKDGKFPLLSRPLAAPNHAPFFIGNWRVSKPTILDTIDPS